MRCVNEALLYTVNTFITLTYDDEHLPENYSLVKKHHQDFMKRLRKKFPHTTIRFYHCGEYGEVCVDCKTKCGGLGRPHYHTLLFNFDFLDKKFHKQVNGNNLYTSEVLQKLWQHKGFCIIGEVTFESAAYVARYVMKKVTGEQRQERYEYVNQETGEITMRTPEYTTMSRRPGIGKDWIERFSGEVRRHDSIVLRGREMKPPRYYDEIYKIEEPERYEKLKEERKQEALKHKEDNTISRLKVRERVKNAQTKSLKRTL